MRSLVSDSSYFQFLDEAGIVGGTDVTIASMQLIKEFPNLRREEAKAICADWRSLRHKRRMQA